MLRADSAANWVVDSSWQWSPLFDTQYGKATAPPTVTTYGPNGTGVVWTRRFESGVEVSVNCTPAAASGAHVWCTGNFTHDLPVGVERPPIISMDNRQ